MSIRFGACIGTDTDKLAALAAAGYDYAEASIQAIAAMTDDEYESFAVCAKSCPITVEACNSFFPGEIKLVGEDMDPAAVASYTEKALDRIARLGVKIAVLGSGKARMVPEGFDPKKAEEQFAQVLRICGDIAVKHDITIVVEPLRTGECNFINTVADGLVMVKKADHPTVKCLADFYHVFMNGETMDAIKTSAGELRHTHIARANADRLVPHCHEDEAACRIWAEALAACNYSGRLSLEGSFGDDFEGMIQKAKKYLSLFNA